MHTSSADDLEAASEIRRLVAASLAVEPEDVVVRRPAGGFSDSTFDVTLPGRHLMARMISSARPEGMRRERAALTVLARSAASGRVPRLASGATGAGETAPTQDGVVREFVRGEAVDKLPDPEVALDATIRAIAEVHMATPSAVTELRRIDSELRWDAFEARPLRSDPDDRVRHLVDALSEDLVLEGARCLVHGDLNPSNLILDPDSGQVVLIDWERAATGPPELDLGSFCFAWLTTFGNEVEPFLARVVEQYAAVGGRNLTTGALAGATLVASRLVVPPLSREFDDWLVHAHLELLFLRNRRVWLDLALVLVNGDG